MRRNARVIERAGTCRPAARCDLKFILREIMKTFAAGLMVAGTVLAAAPLAAQSASTPGVRADAVELPEDTVFEHLLWRPVV